jgi:hypothetical protein
MACVFLEGFDAYDPPDGDAAYVAAQTVGKVDHYRFTDLPVTPTEIVAVRVVSFARKED